MKNTLNIDRNKIIGGTAILIIFCIFLIVGWKIGKPVPKENEKEVFADSMVKKDEQNLNRITVYVNGEVKKPGVYLLKENSRIQELINIAGGFTQNADTMKLNLAQKLRDEDYIYVETKVEGNEMLMGSAQNSTSKNSKINLNKASKEELKTIPGIGESTAQKIVDYREKNRGFKKIEDLMQIDRIGQKTFDKIKDKIDIR